MKRIILLNGPSSSGKSTLSRALQKLIKDSSGKDYEIISIDDFMKLAYDEVIYEDDVFEISGDMCDKMREVLETSDGAIIDHVITSERIFTQLAKASKGFCLKTVRVTCPLEVLQKREAERKNRCIGSAKDSYDYLYPKEGYDLTVDTHKNSAEECAEIISAELINR